MPASTTCAASTSTSPRPPHRLHRPVGVGQVVARLRHDLRRGPAPLHRVAVVLRPPVPRPGRPARRRLHRGPLPGDLHRPEVGRQQPPLHGRDDHRDRRLPPRALGPHRRSPTARSAAPTVIRQTPQQIVDRILELPDGTRFQVLAPVVRGRKGTYETGARGPRRPGLLPGPGRRRADRPRRQGRPRPLRAAHHRGRRRPARPARGHRAPAHRLPRDRPEAGRGRGRGRDRRPRRREARPTPRRSPSPSTSPARTATAASRSWPRATSRSTRPTAPASGATASAPATRSTPSWSCPNPDAEHRRRRHRPVGRRARHLLPAPRRRRVRRRRASPPTCRGRSLPAKAKKTLLHGKGGKRPGPRQVPEPVRAGPHLPRQLRGRDPVPAAPAHRVRERHRARADRGLDARGAVPGVRRRPAQAAHPRRHDQRPEHRRGLRAVDRRGGRLLPRRSSCPSATA